MKSKCDPSLTPNAVMTVPGASPPPNAMMTILHTDNCVTQTRMTPISHPKRRKSTHSSRLRRHQPIHLIVAVGKHTQTLVSVICVSEDEGTALLIVSDFSAKQLHEVSHILA